MIKLYAMDLRPYEHGLWRQLLPLADARRQARVLACRTDADAMRLACAGILLQKALEREQIPAHAQLFDRHPQGKPFLPQFPHVHFSLSHAGLLAVCAVADHPVGVDAELPRCTPELAKRHFAPEELAHLDSPDALQRLWTAKEAFLKMLGLGMTVSLNSFTVLLGDEPVLRQEYTSVPYRLQEYRLDDCRICLCTTDEKPQIEFL